MLTGRVKLLFPCRIGLDFYPSLILHEANNPQIAVTSILTSLDSTLEIGQHLINFITIFSFRNQRSYASLQDVTAKYGYHITVLS